ncbi:MAG TPA: hypothetical protein DCW83_13435 [Saprospirales bacterium]|jgi:hypothetical protein|nr:hypothetical protein [Saprospirales bacterium]
MKIMKLYNKLFITGCDSNTKWMLPWFKEKFYKHMPNAHLEVFDFDTRFLGCQTWFKKPSSMIAASGMARSVCWLDTDCEIRSNIEDIFNYAEHNKLSLVEDVPWTKRRGETWHNSGVVVFKGLPSILANWAKVCKIKSSESTHPMYGDQDILHELVGQNLNRIVSIIDIPRDYNVLRLDLLDNTNPPNIKVMHWTGAKGKAEIKKQMISETIK